MQKRKKTVIISVINDLVTDQRVHKVSQTLYNIGYNILLVGRRLPDSLDLTKRDYNTKRFKLIFLKGPLFYAEINIRLFFFLLFKKFDIALANDLDTLPANYFAAFIKRKKLVYDCHEIFTEVPELIHRSFTKKIWELIEKCLLPKVKYAYTVNKSVANYYAIKYGVSMNIVRNVPIKHSITKKDTKRFNEKKKIIVYQGALNIGRGLEIMIESMQYIKNVDFNIIGDGDIKQELIKLVKQLKLEDKVKFLGKIPFKELHYYTEKADLGVSLEEDLGLNYRYSLPNKIFDYIHAGIPVLVSDLPEMSELIIKYRVGEILKNRTPEELANKIEFIFKDIKRYTLWMLNTIKAKEELCWEQEEKNIVSLFNSINL
ncbi:MAG: glycosyltransferase family 4 protein [Chlorobi bacterium]|nr:glycosyltransferase family 4 protein [Chlorobiota bacterium]